MNWGLVGMGIIFFCLAAGNRDINVMKNAFLGLALLCFLASTVFYVKDEVRVELEKIRKDQTIIYESVLE